jgi:hypothetical protein
MDIKCPVDIAIESTSWRKAIERREKYIPFARTPGIPIPPSFYSS